MKEICKKLTIILSFITLTCAFGACNGKKDNDNDPDNHEGQFSPLELESNGEKITDYKIVVAKDAGESILYAADRLQYNVKKSLNEDIPIVRDSESESGFEILVGETSRKEDDSIDFSSLGKEAYVVKTVGKDLVIAGNERGAIYGVYAYLEALGYRYYTPDVTYYPLEKKIFVPKELSLTWEPTFTYREQLYHCAFDSEWAVSQGINGSFIRSDMKTDAKYGGQVGYVGGDSWTCHTSARLLPTSIYYATHPEYYAEGGTDPCWSNEDAMEIMYQNVLAAIDRDPTASMIDISMNDIANGYCHCETCTEQQEEYGVSGWYYRRINWFARKLKIDRPGVLVHTIAYAYAKEPPENLIMEDNVIVQYCPTRMCRWHTEENECEYVRQYTEWAKKWRDITTELHIYEYSNNWSMIYARDGNLDAMRTKIRMYAENGATGVYVEGYSRENPEFGELKSYLFAKLLKNPWMSQEEYKYHINDFMEGYYGDAAEYLMQYIDESTELIIKMQDESGDHLAHWYGIDENFPFEYDFATHSYDMTFIDRFNELFDLAEDSVAGAEYDRVRKSRIHWTYIELYNTFENRLEYSDADEYEDLIARNEELYNDIKRYGCLQRYDNDKKLGTIDDFTMCVCSWWK